MLQITIVAMKASSSLHHIKNTQKEIQEKINWCVYVVEQNVFKLRTPKKSERILILKTFLFLNNYDYFTKSEQRNAE